MSDATVSGMNVGQFIMWLIQFGFTSVEPLIAQVIEDFRDNKITAEEADLRSQGKFSAMMIALKDPAAEESARAVETERRLHEKFDHTDTKVKGEELPSEEPKVEEPQGEPK